MRASLLFVSLMVAASQAACGASVLVHRPADPVVDQAETVMWTAEIQRVARDGDWILVRSYAGAGDAIVLLTRGEELSHAAIYDAQHGTVIEAITPVVREVSIASLVQRNRYLIVVRPTGATPAAGKATLARARAQLGAGFDLRGFVGLGRDDRFYCSELAYWAADLGARDPAPPAVITPAMLLGYGEVVYWSGRRDDPQAQRAALGWAAAQPHTAPTISAR